ncbi:MAG: hypothetical protein LJE68_07500 [Rhodobacter sp.]|nr:hypothetical protein [Rhodobacter sp.]
MRDPKICRRLYCCRKTLSIMLLVSVALFGLARPADAACGLQTQFDELVRALNGIAVTNRTVDRGQAERIERLAATVDQRALHRRLRDAGYEDKWRDLGHLIAESAAIGKVGSLPNKTYLRDQLRKVGDLTDKICAGDRGGGASLLSIAGLSQFLGLSQLHPFEGSGSLSVSPHLLGVLFVMMLCIVALLLATRHLYRWIFSLIYNRKSCSIGAALHIGGETVEGRLTILGKKGCRFMLRTEEDFARLQKLVDDPKGEVAAGGHRIKAQVFGLYGNFAVIFFDRPNTMEVHREILSMSTTTPHYVPKTTPKPNLKPRPRPG